MTVQDHGAIVEVCGRAVLCLCTVIALPTLGACSTLLAPPPDVAEAAREASAGPVYSCQREPEGTRILRIVKAPESR